MEVQFVTQSPILEKYWQLQIGSIIGGWKTGNVVGEEAAEGFFCWRGNGGGRGGE